MESNKDLEKDRYNAPERESQWSMATGAPPKVTHLLPTGTVNSYPTKARAEQAAKNVAYVIEWAKRNKTRSSNDKGKNTLQIGYSTIGKVEDENTKKKLERALRNNWFIEGLDIEANSKGDTISLNGTVHSMYQKEEAERIAWNIPGVMYVENGLIIAYNN